MTIGGASSAYSSNMMKRVGTNKSYPVYDYKAAQKNTQSIINQYKESQDEVKKLKADTTKFLDTYRNSMTEMSKSAESVSESNLTKILSGEGGVDKAVKSVQNMVDKFNDSLNTLNKNSDRGYGVEKQIGRMVLPPTSESSMKEVGITVNKDGTLKLDQSKLKDMFEKQPKLAKDIIGGNFGVASGIKRDARNGLTQSPGSVISNDLAQIKNQQTQNPVNFMSTYNQSGIYNVMNMNAVGVLMNMTV